MPILIFILLIFIQTLSAQEHSAGQLIVQFEKQIDTATWYKNYSAFGSLTPLVFDWNLYVLDYDEKKISRESLFKLLRDNNEVRNVQPNHILKLRSMPNDPRYAQWQWNLELLGLPEAWAYTTGGITATADTIVVAVIDGGCDIGHEDIAANIWTNNNEIPGDGIDNDENGYIDDYLGWQFVSQNDTHEVNSHGTSVSGIIAAVGNNAVGISGINWNLKLMQLSAAEQDLLLESNLIRAYAYVLKQRRLYRESAGQKGAFVVAVNLSAGIDFGKPEDFPLWCAIYDSLGKEGILSVGAVMNNDINIDNRGDMPSLCPSLFHLAVSNSTRFDALDNNAAYGKVHVDLAAPGAVYTLRPDNSYNVFGGTSGAAPHVAGAIALLSAYPDINWAIMQKTEPERAAKLIREIILNSVEKNTNLEDKTMSGGRLHIGAAMKYLERLYSIPQTILTLQVWDNNQLLVKFLAESPGDYICDIFDTMGRHRVRKKFSVATPGVETFFMEMNMIKNEILFLRISDSSGKRIATLKF